MRQRPAAVVSNYQILSHYSAQFSLNFTKKACIRFNNFKNTKYIYKLKYFVLELIVFTENVYIFYEI